MIKAKSIYVLLIVLALMYTNIANSMTLNTTEFGNVTDISIAVQTGMNTAWILNRDMKKFVSIGNEIYSFLYIGSGVQPGAISISTSVENHFSLHNVIALKNTSSLSSDLMAEYDVTLPIRKTFTVKNDANIKKSFTKSYVKFYLDSKDIGNGSGLLVVFKVNPTMNDRLNDELFIEFFPEINATCNLDIPCGLIGPISSGWEGWGGPFYEFKVSPSIQQIGNTYVQQIRKVGGKLLDYIDDVEDISKIISIASLGVTGTSASKNLNIKQMEEFLISADSMLGQELVGSLVDDYVASASISDELDKRAVKTAIGGVFDAGGQLMSFGTKGTVDPVGFVNSVTSNIFKSIYALDAIDSTNKIAKKLNNLIIARIILNHLYSFWETDQELWAFYGLDLNVNSYEELIREIASRQDNLFPVGTYCSLDFLDNVNGYPLNLYNPGFWIPNLLCEIPEYFIEDIDTQEIINIVNNYNEQFLDWALNRSQATNYLLSDVDGDGFNNTEDEDPNDPLIPPPPNRKPVIVFTPHETFTYEIDTLISVDASASYDPEGQNISASWEFIKPDNSAAILNTISELNVEFTPDIPGVYQAKLVLSDSVDTVISGQLFYADPLASDGHDLFLSGFNMDKVKLSPGDTINFDVSIQNNGLYDEFSRGQINIVGPQFTDSTGPFDIGLVTANGMTQNFNDVVSYTLPSNSTDGIYAFSFTVFSDNGDEKWIDNTEVADLQQGETDAVLSDAYRVKPFYFCSEDPSPKVSISTPLGVYTVELILPTSSNSPEIKVTKGSAIIDSSETINKYTAEYFDAGNILIAYINNSGLVGSGFNCSQMELSFYLAYADSSVTFERVSPESIYLGETVTYKLNIGEEADESDYRDGPIYSFFPGKTKGTAFQFNHDVNSDDRISNLINVDLTKKSYGGDLTLKPRQVGYHDFITEISPFNWTINSNLFLFVGHVNVMQRPLDSDLDGVLDDADAFKNDISASVDLDLDGVPDAWHDGYVFACAEKQIDLDPTDPLVNVDSDCDGVPDFYDAFDNDPAEAYDSDGDLVGDNADGFDNDPAASVDSDGDGHPDYWNDTKTELDSTTGLTLDEFKDDPAEWADSDGDLVGDNADAFDQDPAASLDTDRDGYPDEWNPGKTQNDSITGLVLDEFKDDPTEWVDTDGDLIGDNKDAFYNDPAASLDTDRDGYPDEWNLGKTQLDSTTGLVLDAFKLDPKEWADSDGDLVGDNSDVAPNDPTRSVNIAPTISPVADQVLAQETITQIDLIVNDLDGDSVVLKLLNPPNFVFLQDNQITINTISVSPGAFTLGVLAKDGFSGIDTISFNITISANQDNDLDGIIDINDPDDDNDGMPDIFESAYNFDPLNDLDAAEDYDQDGYSNLKEFQQSTNPTNAASNGSVLEQVHIRLFGSFSKDDDGYGEYVNSTQSNLFVGAPYADSVDSVSRGAVYVYDRVGEQIVFRQILYPSLQGSVFFGAAIAATDKYLVVGDSGYRSSGTALEGRVYIFEKNQSGDWVESQILNGYGGRFGFSVAIDNDEIVVGARDLGFYTGAAYVYKFNPNTNDWVEEVKITGSDSTSSSSFATKVAISNSVVVVGAPYQDNSSVNSGAAYVFERDELGQWGQTQKIQSVNGSAYSSFGWSVSIQNDSILVGAPTDSNNDNNLTQGAAYLFKKQNSITWEQDHKFVPVSSIGSESFGSSVSVSGGIYLVGSYGEHINLNSQSHLSGSAHVYTSDISGNIFELKKLYPGDGQTGDFGRVVSLVGDEAFIGSIGQNYIGSYSDTAYFFKLDQDQDGIGDSQDVDIDGDGLPNDWEITYHLNIYDPVDAGLDADKDGSTNLEEFQRGSNPIVSQYNLTANWGTGGSADQANATVDDGSTASFTVTAETGYTTDAAVTGTCPTGSWAGNVYTTGAVIADCTVDFSFTQDTIVIQHTVSATWGTGGSANASSATVLDGQHASFIVTPNAGYTADAIVSSSCAAGSWIGNQYTTGTITSDCSVNFSFTFIGITQHAVTATVGTGGNVSTETQLVDDGNTTQFGINPNTGYAVDTVVGGTCPAGYFANNNSVYVTGVITGNCSVYFSFLGSIDISSGLIAHYALENNVLDSSINGLNGLESSRLTYTAGVLDQAATFNQQWVDLPSVSLTAFTVSLNVKFGSISNASGGSIYTLGTNQHATESAFRLMVFQSGEIVPNLENSSADTLSTLGADISDGAWHHVLATVDGLSLAFYVDGTLIDAASSSGTFTFNNVRQALANHWWNNYANQDPRFTGSLDEVRLYDRVLNRSEIQELAGQQLQQGLVAHYQFEGNANDSSGNGNDGAEYGGVTYTAGVSGQAANFDGIDDYIQKTNFNLQSDEVTVSMWIRSNSIPDWYSPMLAIHSGHTGFIGHGDEGLLGALGSNSTLTFSYADSDGSIGTEKETVDTLSTLNINTWTHIAVIRSGGNLSHFYVNGIDQTNILNSGINSGFNIVNGLLEIGAPNYWGSGDGWTQNGRGNKWNGQIDDLRIYNRALSHTEINNLSSKTTENSVFSDTFDNGLTKWSTFGSPVPAIVASIDGYTNVFDNKGDASYNSGAVSTDAIDLSNGGVIEADVYLDFSNLSGCWASTVIGITKDANPVLTSTGFGDRAIKWAMNADGEACSGTAAQYRQHAWFGFTILGEAAAVDFPASYTISADSYVNGWHKAKIKVRPDRFVEFYIDDTLLWTSTITLDPVYLTGRKLFISGRSSGSAGKAYHDNVAVNPYTTQTDTEAPVITLNGSNPITLNVGDSYVEPGFVVTDNIDINLSTSVQVTGTLDTSTIATYTLTYNVSDTAGNAAIPVTREVIVQSTVLDSDGDGIPDSVEDATAGLDKNVKTDAAGDLDGDGVSNLVEYQQGSNLLVDDIAPVLSAPTDIVINASGYLSGVNFGSVIAQDGKDGPINAVPDQSGPFVSGTYSITWTATDEAGNSVSVTQGLTIYPLVSLEIDRQVVEGNAIQIPVTLSGDAPAYPVTVDYLVSGTSDAQDHDLTSGQLTIGSGHEGSLSVDIIDDGIGESAETLIITLDQATNAALSSDAQQVLTIVADNLAPSVELQVSQNTTPTRYISKTDGPVTISGVVTDQNIGDTHNLSWAGTDNNIVDTDSDETTMTFDPSLMNPGIYQIHLQATDNGGLTAKDSTDIRILATPITLSPTQDSDSDGLMDQQEGIGDSDSDGIPDYQDPQGQTGNFLPLSNGRVMQTNAGLILKLGRNAFGSGNGTAVTTLNDIASYGGAAGGVSVSDDLFTAKSEIIDFEIDGLAQAGDSASVIISLSQAIPSNAVYRKFLPTQGWVTLTEGSGYLIQSVASVNGGCPAIDSSAYTNGLTAGDDCLKLTLVDGGAFDGDGEIDGRICDPGVIAVANAPTNPTNPGGGNASTDSGGSGGGGGSLKPIFLTMLMLLLVYQFGMMQRSGLRVRRK